MMRRPAPRAASAALLALTTLLAAPVSLAHDGEHGGEKRVLLQAKALSDAPGKKAIMATVHYAPGQASIPHYHPGSVFAYVLEGEVVSQLDGEPPVSYKAGDSWYEAPRTPHNTSRNASASKPATLLVWLLMTDGDEISVPLGGK
jgi:quercetin dioxygenase-like cupin family protein